LEYIAALVKYGQRLLQLQVSTNFAERVEADKRNLQSFQSIKAPASSIIGELRYQQMTGFIHEECGTLYARAPSVHIKTTLEVGVR